VGTQKVILDTNILISAFGWPGKPKTILNMVLAGQLELVIPQAQMDEIGRVVTYPRLKFTKDQQQRFVSLLTTIATVVNTTLRLDIVKDDPSDNIFLETAVEHHVSVIVSGDDHLLKLKKYQDVQIFTPAQFLDIFFNT